MQANDPLNGAPGPNTGDASSPESRPAGSAGQPNEPGPARGRLRRRFWLLAGLGAAAASLAACAQHGPGPFGGGPGWGHHHGWHASSDPAEMGRRVDKAVEWVLSDVGASAEQKAKVSGIAKQAFADLAPLRERHREARKQAATLLSAPAIDRDAIERLRADELRMADDASRRLTKALADVAEALTPAQRVQLKDRIERRMARRGA